MKLFVYEHCPYCIRPRVVLGYKNIGCDIEYLLDNDIDGHTEKIGAKQVPILQKEDKSYMTESLDIVDYLDNLNANPIFTKTNGRNDIEKIFSEMSSEYRTLIFSYVQCASLGEFATDEARQYFIKRYLKHINLDNVNEAIELREKHKEKVENTLKKLEKCIYSKKYISDCGLSMDDVIYFANLQRMLIVPDLNIPLKISEYMEYQLSKNNCNIKYI
jgi:glutaredoxin 2